MRTTRHDDSEMCLLTPYFMICDNLVMGTVY